MANDPSRRDPGEPKVPDRSAAPGGREEGARRKEEHGLPEHRQMSVRRDLGEGDIEASEYEDEMSHTPTRSDGTV